MTLRQLMIRLNQMYMRGEAPDDADVCVSGDMGLVDNVVFDDGCVWIESHEHRGGCCNG